MWKRAGLVVLAAGLAGCGGAPAAVGSVAGGGVSQAKVQSATQPATTEVIRLNPQPAAKPDQTGSCWTTSLATDHGYRCAADNMLLDPCFAVEGDSMLVVCEPDPLHNLPGTTLRLTETLALIDAPANELAQGWLVELADGTVCERFTGTLGVIDDESAVGTYGCVAGPDGVLRMLLDDLQPGQPWQARLATLVEGDGRPLKIKESAMVAIKRVWQ